jgi:hypothetical protein
MKALLKQGREQQAWYFSDLLIVDSSEGCEKIHNQMDEIPVSRGRFRYQDLLNLLWFCQDKSKDKNH